MKRVERQRVAGGGGWEFGPVCNILHEVLASILVLGVAVKLAGLVNRGSVEFSVE